MPTTAQAGTALPDPQPGGSFDTRSCLQLSVTAPEFSGGVSGGSPEQRSLPPCRIRTDRGKSKKKQESGQGSESPNLQGFSVLKGPPVPGKQPETAANANGRSAPI